MALTAVFLSTTAFAQSAGEKTGINSTLGIAPTTADFIKEAATSDMLEIDAARLRSRRATPGEDVRRADDHGSHQNQRRTQGSGHR